MLSLAGKEMTEMQANGRKQGLGVLFGHVNCEMPIRHNQVKSHRWWLYR